MSWCIQDHTHILWFARRTHRTQHTVAQMARIYYSNPARLHSRSLGRGDTLASACRNTCMGFIYFPSQPRREHTRRLSLSQKWKFNSMCLMFLPGKRIWDPEFRAFHGNWSHRHCLSGKNQNGRLCKENRCSVPQVGKTDIDKWDILYWFGELLYWNNLNKEINIIALGYNPKTKINIY